MIYVYGVLGFVIGFAFGQMLLFFLLRGVSKEDMLNDRHIQLKYGLMNWGLAILSCYGAIELYQRYL